MSHTLKVGMILGLALGSSQIAGYAHAGPLPPNGGTSGYVMGIAADTGLSFSGTTVNGWADEVTAAQLVNGGTGAPKAGTIVTPNGTHAAVSFLETGTGAGQGDGLSLNNAAALQLESLSIFVVANVTDGHLSQEFISDYSPNSFSHGWAHGMSDGTADQPKWFTGPDSTHGLSDATGATLGIGTAAENAYLLIDTATVNGADTIKTTYAGNLLNLTNTQTNSETLSGYSIPYNTDGSQQVGVGYLNAFGGLQYLTGNIAEILVYNNQAPGYSASAVTAYLEAKYFAVPEPSSVVLLALGAFGMFIIRRRSA